MVIDSKGKMFEERRKKDRRSGEDRRKENEKVIDNKRKEDRRKMIEEIQRILTKHKRA